MSRLRFGALISIALAGALLASLVAPARPGESATATPTPSASGSPAASSSATPTPSTAPTPTSTAAPSGSGSTPEPSASAKPSATPTPTPSATPTGPTLWAMLEAMSAEGLILKNEACTFYPSPTAGCTSAYDRSLFRHWVDADGDGCDSRREVLIAEAVTTPVIGSGCVLSGGTWNSPYDGVATSSDGGSFDIDHMVPLKEAWISGAYRWSAARREAFANDLDASFSLIAVSASSNRSKSDRDPASWLPTTTGYRCRYITDWIAVKLRWSLTVDFDEYTVLRDYADRCPAAPYVVVAAP